MNIIISQFKIISRSFTVVYKENLLRNNKKYWFLYVYSPYALHSIASKSRVQLGNEMWQFLQTHCRLLALLNEIIISVYFSVNLYFWNLYSCFILSLLSSLMLLLLLLLVMIFSDIVKWTVRKTPHVCFLVYVTLYTHE